MFTLPQSNNPDEKETQDGIDIVQLDERSQPLRYTLLFCYPDPSTIIDNIYNLMAVAQIAEKYEMGVIKEQACDIIKLSAVIMEDPFRIFAFAFRFGWKDIGEIAARKFLAVPMEDFPLSKELRYIRLHEFHYLSDHRRRCSAVIKNWLVGDDDLHPKNLRSFQSLRRVLRDQWCTQSAHSSQRNSEWYQPDHLEFSPPIYSSGNTRISVLDLGENVHPWCPPSPRFLPVTPYYPGERFPLR